MYHLIPSSEGSLHKRICLCSTLPCNFKIIEVRLRAAATVFHPPTPQMCARNMNTDRKNGGLIEMPSAVTVCKMCSVFRENLIAWPTETHCFHSLFLLHFGQCYSRTIYLSGAHLVYYGFRNDTYVKETARIQGNINGNIFLQYYEMLWNTSNINELELEYNSAESNVYWTVHHCNSWRMKDQLDVTCYIISLIMCSTYFGH